MRVAHATDVFLPHVGGIELHVRDLVAHQRAHGWQSRVWTAAAAPPAGHADPVPVDRVLRDRRMRGWVVRMLREQRPDVVHAHVSVFSPFASLVTREAAALGIPTLVTVHSMWTGLGPLPGLTTRALGVADWPVVWSAVSRPAAAALEVALGHGLVAKVLPNAVDVEAWRDLDPRKVPAAGTPEDPLSVVSVMRLTRTKRILPMLRIMADVRRRVPDHVALRTVVIGDGPLRARAEREIRRLDLDGWVELTGQLRRDEIQDHLRGAALYLAPAELESFGLAPLEARSAGLPVVARAGTGVEEFVEHGTSGFLARDDRELAAWTTRLLLDRALQTEMTAHNRTHRSPLTWEHAHDATRALYDEACALAPGRRSQVSVRVG